MNMLKSEFYSLINIDNDPALHLALKKWLLNVYKTEIYLSLQPQMGGFIEKNSVSVSVLSSIKNDKSFLLKCGIFYEEKIGGCNCHDDPHSENGYCEIQIKMSEHNFNIL